VSPLLTMIDSSIVMSMLLGRQGAARRIPV
jgi:hypothetical protein